MKSMQTKPSPKEISFEDFRKEILSDYKIAVESRQASLLGRKEVLTGKAKFGIFGDGKEIAQLAMAKVFKKGDFRSGYYRDQTFMFAIGACTLQEFFAQLYANPNVEAEPATAGRSMNGHYATRSLNEDGSWKDLTKIKNSSADISPTGGQMPRLLGLAYASKLYKQNPYLQQEGFSVNGNEVAFGTIGDASTSEGIFWEAINAAGVLQVPMAISVWDDGYGISVPAKYQTTKQNISETLKGFERSKNGEGYLIYSCNGWDYVGLCEMYQKGISICREEHIPILFHVKEMTQPQGHSTSGSHERYKTKERLLWEDKFDCIQKMREWILASELAEEIELDQIDEAAKENVLLAKKKAWEDYNHPIQSDKKNVVRILDAVSKESVNGVFITKLKSDLENQGDASRRDLHSSVRKALRYVREEDFDSKNELVQWLNAKQDEAKSQYNSHLQSETNESALRIKAVAPTYDSNASLVDGREVLQANFDAMLKKDSRVLAFGEDVGKIGGVNQTYSGLQEKYGEHRVLDTGIREATIIGQGIGLALRGFRPIAEIQYLDYLLYAIQILSDDLATLLYRTKGGQKAPLIISTRGHRLEGIWHSGSPMGMIIHAVRGIHVCVPRNMTQAAGFYNTLLASDEPGIIIEPLNAYRLKENLPNNVGEFRTALGVPEILAEGNDVTIVSYGSTCRIAQDVVKQLLEVGISAELIDVQTLLPFDVNHSIVDSIRKTNKVLFLDEDVPGGATSYMMQEVLENQKAYQYLDSAPSTLTAKAHRPAYGSDGDYFSKPSAEDIFEKVYFMMNESDPKQYPLLY